MEISHKIEGSLVLGRIEISMSDYVNNLVDVRQTIRGYLSKLGNDMNYEFTSDGESFVLAETSPKKSIGFKIHFRVKTEQEIESDRIESFISRLEKI
jgi:hypothetical protein